MKAPQVLGPKGSKMLRNWTVKFLYEPSSCDAKVSAWLDEVREVVEV